MEKTADCGARDASASPLPADRAFVLQLRSQADAGADVFVGRIEHVASGTTEQFFSAAGLIGFVQRVLERGVAARIASEEEA